MPAHQLFFGGRAGSEQADDRLVDQVAETPFPMMVFALVDGDPDQPGFIFGFLPEVPQVLVAADKHFLDNVLALCTVVDIDVSNPFQLVRMLTDEAVEQFTVPRAGFSLTVCHDVQALTSFSMIRRMPKGAGLKSFDKNYLY